MEITQQWPSRLFLKVLTLVIVLGLVVPAQAVYFYIENAAPKCFYEELPKDTLVVGQCWARMFESSVSLT